MGSSRSLCFLLAMLCCCPLAGAAGFQVELKLGDGKTTQSQQSKPSPGPAVHRISLDSSVNAPFSATWKVTRTDPVDAKGVLVHFVVVKLDRPGQAIPALEPVRVPIEGALTMDFARGKTATGTHPFHVDSPGVYLVRIEAGVDPDMPGREDYAEIELVVK